MGTGGFKFSPKQTGLAAKLEEERKKSLTTTEKENSVDKPRIEFVDASKAKDRIGIIFDDSGSMYGQKIKDARDGTIEFMRNCIPNDTACAVYPMNYDKDNVSGIKTLTTNLPKLSGDISNIEATACTPMFESIRETYKFNFNRLIVFSDGVPDYPQYLEQVIEELKEKKIPCDTVYISGANATEADYGAQLLKKLAEGTGGYFLIFQQGKVNFRTAFKYLAPVHRLQLADGNFRKALEEGKLA